MVGIITQARVNSSRLPNKIFKEAAGKPYLQHHIERLQHTGLPIIVATTDDGSEEPIVQFCKKYELACYRGDEANVLERYYQSALEHRLMHIIRVTSDCPLVDPQLIVKGFAAYSLLGENTYYSNALERTYPRGMDYEIFSFGALQEAYRNASELSDKEHVTPYIWKNKSGKINLVNDVAKVDYSSYRVTLDTREDELLLRILIENHNATELSCSQIVSVLQQQPDLVAINVAIEQKKVQ